LYSTLSAWLDSHVHQADAAGVHSGVPESSSAANSFLASTLDKISSCSEIPSLTAAVTF